MTTDERSEYMRAWRAANKERCLNYEKHKKICLEKNRERQRRWRENNPDANRARARQWHKDKPEKSQANGAKRRAATLQRTITLTPEHEAALKRIYAHAKVISKVTKIPHHVDHIVPLQGKEMSGLHVPWNLEVVPARDNLAKSNKVDYSRALPTCMDRVDA